MQIGRPPRDIPHGGCYERLDLFSIQPVNRVNDAGCQQRPARGGRGLNLLIGLRLRFGQRAQMRWRPQQARVRFESTRPGPRGDQRGRLRNLRQLLRARISIPRQRH